MSDYVVCMMTAPNEAEAKRIGRTLVEERLAACCNVIPNVTSIYTWKGKVREEGEVICLMKTRKELFSAIKKRIKELHPYDVPEIISLKIKDGLYEYLKWIDEVTGQD